MIQAMLIQREGSRYFKSEPSPALYARISRLLVVMCASLTLFGCGSSGEQDADGKTVYISSDPKRLPKLLMLPRDEPIEMLNMIRFKDIAEYEVGSGFEHKGWTGAQAYTEYSRRSQVVIDRLGAKIVYAGKPLMTVIGPAEEQWDAIFVLRYKDASAFRALLTDEEYETHKFHRAAGVADSRLIRLAAAPRLMPNADAESE